MCSECCESSAKSALGIYFEMVHCVHMLLSAKSAAGIYHEMVQCAQNALNYQQNLAAANFKTHGGAQNH